MWLGIWYSNVVVEFCVSHVYIYYRALRAILINLFCIVCNFVIFVWNAAAHIGHAYVINGLILLMFILEVKI